MLRNSVFKRRRLDCQAGPACPWRRSDRLCCARSSAPANRAPTVQLLRDERQAEDGVQEAVLLAWLNLRSLARADSFGAWLAGIALRVCHGWLRYKARQAWSLDALLGGRLLPEP